MNLFSISGFLTGVMSLALAITVYFNSRTSFSNKLFSIFALAVAVWGFGNYQIGLASNPAHALFWWKFGHIGIILIPVLFIHFLYAFLERKNYLLVYAVYAIGIFFFILNLTPFFIVNVRWAFDQFYYHSLPNFSYVVFTIFFLSTLMYSNFILWNEYRKSTGARKVQITYFFLAVTVGFWGGSISFLPVFGIDLYPFTNVVGFLYPLILSYAILKHQLFNIKVIATEVLVIGISIVLFSQIFLSETLFEQVFRGVLFGCIVVLGSLLIRSVLKEIRQREQLEILTNDLQVANNQLRELDEQKSDFISIASHQLRTPLTTIKGYISLILEGSFGTIPSVLLEPLRRVQVSNDRLITLVGDLLNLSRIEHGKMTYVFQEAAILTIATEVIQEMQEAAKQKNLELKLILPKAPVQNSSLDPQKIKEVFINIIDNALTYTAQGSVTVAVNYLPQTGMVRTIVQDTGIGITPQEMSGLFQKFSRAEGAKKVSSKGTGLGLYVAKLIIEDHKGKIWAESDGRGKGTRFTFDVPALDKNK